MPGSSPRARGTPSALCTIRDSVRFIPAGAGNTMFSRWPSHISPVHPRGRGEHSLFMQHTRFPAGSSPRARGTLQSHAAVRPARRFIPAGAGNTRTLVRAIGSPAVHPRGRGEHEAIKQRKWDLDGSSPRARGTPYGSRADHRGWTVHPRGRGEHCCRVREHAGQPGSSPRARGTRAANSRCEDD